MVGPDVIPLPHIYGARIKGVEVFCPLDPPASVRSCGEPDGPGAGTVHVLTAGGKRSPARGEPWDTGPECGFKSSGVQVGDELNTHR